MKAIYHDLCVCSQYAIYAGALVCTGLLGLSASIMGSSGAYFGTRSDFKDTEYTNRLIFLVLGDQDNVTGSRPDPRLSYHRDYLNFDDDGIAQVYADGADFFFEKIGVDVRSIEVSSFGSVPATHTHFLRWLVVG